MHDSHRRAEKGRGEKHIAVYRLFIDLEQVCTPRPDLLDTPLENCDNVLFVDGSASKDPQTGLNKVGFAVTTEFEVGWTSDIKRIACV